MPKKKASAPPEKEGDPNSPNDTNHEGRWGAARLAPTEGDQIDPEWVIQGTKTRTRNWRVALVSTVALMGLIVTTALGAPKILSGQEKTQSASLTPAPA